MKKIKIKIGKRKQEVFGVYGNDRILIPKVVRGACLLTEDLKPVLRWVKTQEPFKLGFFTKLELGLIKIDVLHVASLAFISYAVLRLLWWAFTHD